ncbi:MAG: YebC/PmpR family DNA-binding transcriptional regulator, partial [Candidatus Colwellbacteria bacterium]|nr:YebC/PmpR family DNA-binding transcriptional regulator [Candidatus Colwellbacteria bacterium]
NPHFNPRLRSLLERAKDEGIPRETTEHAIRRARDAGTDELLLEAYGPGGSAFLISALTDNKNRTVAEIKKLLSDRAAKLAEPGSVRWLFRRESDGWTPLTTIQLDAVERERVARLVEVLDGYADVLGVATNALP